MDSIIFEGFTPGSAQPGHTLRFRVTSKEDRTVSVYRQYGTMHGHVEIPGSVVYEGTEYAVTAIDNDAFFSRDIDSVVIPDTVKSIGNGAFNHCETLRSITMPDSVTSIGEYAFSWCSALAYADIPDSVVSIGKYAFQHCSALSSLVIPGSVKSIGAWAFDCSGISSVVIPKSVESIGTGAFSMCSALNRITVEEGNAVYDSREGCNAVIETATNTLIAGCASTLRIPRSVTAIGACAFAGCERLSIIDIPESIVSIGSGAFQACGFSNTLARRGKFYKAFKPDLTAQGRKFDECGINVFGPILWDFGFRYCDNPLTVFDTKEGKEGEDFVLWEVNPMGQIIKGNGHSHVCSRLQLLRRVSFFSATNPSIMEEEANAFVDKVYHRN